MSLLSEPALAGIHDYTITLRARKIAGDEGFLVLFRARGERDWCWWNVGGWGNRRHAIEKCVAGRKSMIGEPRNGSVETGRWYDIRIELSGPRIRCYLDNELVQTAEETTPPDFAAVAGRVDKTGEIIVKVVNGAETDREIAIDLRSAGPGVHEGTAWVLTSKSQDDENTFDQPGKVSPGAAAISSASPVFTRTFPARSLTILRLKGGG